MTFDTQYLNSGQNANTNRKTVIKGLGPQKEIWTYSGKVVIRDQDELRKRSVKQIIDPDPDIAQYDYMKVGGTTTGSNGVLSFKINNQKVIIFYENPWSGYPGAGICVESANTKVDSKYYDKMYNSWNTYVKSPLLKREPRNGLQDGCLYF